MTRLTLVGACAAMLFAGPAFGQFARLHSHVAAVNPYLYSPAYGPGLTSGYVGWHSGSPSANWAVTGRYSAFHWNGSGNYIGGTGAFNSLGYNNGYGYLGGYFAPRYVFGSRIPFGFDTSYIGYWGYWPYAGWGYSAWYPDNAWQSFELPEVAYSPPAAAAPAESAAPFDRAILALTVPFDATVTVQGAVTKQRGENRMFFSPPLEPGRDYEYTIKVKWKEGGKPVERSQTVNVRPGQRSAVLFLSAAGA